MDRFVRENTWHERLSDEPADLSGKSILVVGMGRIGSRTVKRCVAFDMDTYVLDPNISEADIKAAGATKVTDLKAILPKVDFVSVHCPKSPETVDMFNSETIGLMKPGAFLVNTARGGIVNEEALYDALTRGTLRGAGLDVLDRESRPIPGQQAARPGECDLQPAHGGRHQGVQRSHGDVRHGEHTLRVRRQADRRSLREQGSAGLTASSS